MGAWDKVFADRSKVSSTVSIKHLDGTTSAVKLVMGAGGLSDADFAEAARSGATLSMSCKTTLPNGDVKTKKNTVKSEDIAPKEAHAAVCDLLSVSPEPVRTKGKTTPSPSTNGTPAPEPAAAK